MMLWRFVAHLFIGVIFGYLYHNVGKNADTVLANYVYLYGSLLLVVYTGKMSVTMQCMYFRVLNIIYFIFIDIFRIV